MAASMSASPAALPAEEPPLYDGRVSRTAFEALIGVFYGVAMITAATRLVLQFKTYRRLQVDDYFLIFACLCLTGSTILGYTHVSNLYWTQELNYNPTRFFYLLEENVDIADNLITYQRLYYSYPSLLWATIFAVKFGYLAFFRRLVDRVRPLVIYWRVIVGLSIVAFPMCVISVYVSCMKWGLQAATCLQPVYFHRALGFAITDAVLDIVTDLMIICIPICLLWSVQIRTSQKLVIGLFLSLNLFMTFTAAVRVSGLNFRGTFDIIWLFIWQHIEACVAVSMISLTAFRTVFVSSQTSRARKEPANKPWYSSTVAAIKRRRGMHRSDDESVPGLPSIPSATLTGMRTFIQGGRRSEKGLESGTFTTISEGEGEQWLLHDKPAAIRNAQRMSRQDAV